MVKVILFENGTKPSITKNYKKTTKDSLQTLDDQANQSWNLHPSTEHCWVTLNKFNGFFSLTQLSDFCGCLYSSQSAQKVFLESPPLI